MYADLLLLAFLAQSDPAYVVSGTVVNGLAARPLSNAMARDFEVRISLATYL